MQTSYFWLSIEPEVDYKTDFKMAKIFITGSSDGLGLLAAKSLIGKGHDVVLHARNEERKAETLTKVPGETIVLTADLSDIKQTKKLAEQVNDLGTFDVVIHNTGVWKASADTILSVNLIAPYLLTALINKPKRLIYLSSSMHMQGHAELKRLTANSISYSDSKPYVLMLSNFVAKHWPDVYSNAVDPGWVPTNMGGKSAPDDLQKGFETQVWLAESNEVDAEVSGKYFYHQKQNKPNPHATDNLLQQELIDYCRQVSDLSFPL
ncbi:SDR family NAD(P)-dependent oxidoreductase [Dyadobacter luteus]|nr:SDR family NAD(P)-dependent oxidoreductase [Dyadobacter luteus]